MRETDLLHLTPDTFECPDCGTNGILAGEYCPRNCHLLRLDPTLVYVLDRLPNPSEQVRGGLIPQCAKCAGVWNLRSAENKAKFAGPPRTMTVEEFATDKAPHCRNCGKVFRVDEYPTMYGLPTEEEAARDFARYGQQASRFRVELADGETSTEAGTTFAEARTAARARWDAAHEAIPGAVWPGVRGVWGER